MTQAELHDEHSAILLTGRTQLLEHGGWLAVAAPTEAPGDSS